MGPQQAMNLNFPLKTLVFPLLFSWHPFLVISSCSNVLCSILPFLFCLQGPSLLSQQRWREIFSRRSGDRAPLGFVPGMNLDLLGMNWYLDPFVPVSSMVTFRVIILVWPMGNPSKCPIWSRGHCVLWSFYLWIGSAFSKPENIFELRLLPIRCPRFGFKRRTWYVAILLSDRSQSSFLIFPAFRISVLDNMHWQQIFQHPVWTHSGAWVHLILKCTSETPVVPSRSANSVSVNAQSRLSEHEAPTVRKLNQIKHCGPQCNNKTCSTVQRSRYSLSKMKCNAL